MKSNARKYVRLDEAIAKADKEARKWESGEKYNLIKRDYFEAKSKEFQDKQNELTKILTDEEKDEIEAYYLVGDMFEREEK